jgi:polysaccharide transporter, PST family
LPRRNILLDGIYSVFLGLGKTRENRKLLSNTASLYVLQGVSYILPLVTVPYLVRVLGTDMFGLFAFASSFMGYFQIIVDYGFNLSATREVSLHKNDHFRLSRIYSSVMIVKSGLVVACAIFMAILILGIHRFHSEMSLYMWLYFSTAGSVLFPIWFFQGMEEMGYIAFFNLISRLLVAASYFVLIRSPHDYLKVALLNSLATWLIGIVSVCVVLLKFRVRLAFPGIAACSQCLRDGAQIFASQAAVSLFTNTNTFVLGLFTNNKTVGTYAVAEKIVRACISLTGPVGSAIFPRTSVLFSESQAKAERFLRKVTLAGICVFGLLSMVLFGLADLLVLVVSGNSSPNISFLVRIMAILPLTVFLDNVYGTQILLNTGRQRQFMRIILVGGFLSVAGLFTLVPRIGACGAATSFLVSDLAILTLMFFAVSRAGIHLFGKTTV